MLSRDDNELITRTGPGTPAGKLFRRYWHPVALARELPLKAAPRQVRLLGEDLVLFRTRLGEPGLMDLHCPHRGTDLSYGRIEDDGLRCLYHGWKFGLDGRCLDQPGEPKGSNFKNKVRHVAYPCREAGGLILAYMGEGASPPLPKLPMFDAAPGRVWSTKMWHECNYLQGVEGEVDSQHLSYLHRMVTPGAAPDEHSKGTDWLLAADEAPELECEQTPYGLRLFATRLLGDGRKYVRITNFIMPYTGAFDGGPLLDPRTTNMTDNMGYWMHWHVPIDDTHHWKYIVAHCYDSPIDPEYQYRMIESEMTPAFVSTRDKSNRYLQNRDEMERLTFLGMGYNFQNHDRFATESQRPISDRTKEHLGASDRNVTTMRRLLLQAIKDSEAGRMPLMSGAESGEALSDMVVVSQTVPVAHDNARIWRDVLAERRGATAATK